VTEELEVLYHSTALLSQYGDRKAANLSIASERGAWIGPRISCCHLKPIPNGALEEVESARPSSQDSGESAQGPLQATVSRQLFQFLFCGYLRAPATSKR